MGDADTLIVSVALDAAASHADGPPVAVVAEDTDILVLLLFHRQLNMCDLLFVSESKKGRGGKTVSGKCISIASVQKKIGLDACSCILVAYAFGGCDSTSAIFGLGKGTVFSKINNDVTLHRHCITLQSDMASADDVNVAGIRLMIGLYGTNTSNLLADLRYAAFCNTSLSRRFMPERFPLSENATKQHAKCAHLTGCYLGHVRQFQPCCYRLGLEFVARATEARCT